MYSIAKLLSDEPKKLENLILAILKLLITIWIAQSILDFKSTLSDFTLDSFFKNFRVDQSIYFIVTSIGVWYVLWEIFNELIVSFIIFLLSQIGNPIEFLKWYLWAINSIKIKDDLIIDSNPHILNFTESTNETDMFIINSRAHQIFSVGLVSFLILLNSNISLNAWQISISIFILVNFLLISIIQRKLHDFYIENSITIKHSFYALGQLQKIKNVLNQLEPFKSNFSYESKRKRIFLSKINDKEFLPEKIHIKLMYNSNKELGNKIIQNEGFKISETIKDNRLLVICSNFYLPEQRLTKINENTFCIYGESQDEIYKGFEELIYILKSSDNHQSIDN